MPPKPDKKERKIKKRALKAAHAAAAAKKKSEKNPEKKKKKFFLSNFFNAVARAAKATVKVIKDTLKDLHNPAEIGLLALGVLLPGGMPVYAIYRAHQYHKKAAVRLRPPAVQMV